jgi:hypothetical protein
VIVPPYVPPTEATDEELRAQVGRAVYSAVRDELEEDGRDPVTASRLATRAAKLAVLVLLGVDRDDAAELLTVSKRTAEHDLAHWRKVMHDGSAHRAAARPLPPVVPVEGELS